jgi:hypothetical protein
MNLLKALATAGIREGGKSATLIDGTKGMPESAGDHRRDEAAGRPVCGQRVSHLPGLLKERDGRQ